MPFVPYLAEPEGTQLIHSRYVLDRYHVAADSQIFHGWQSGFLTNHRGIFSISNAFLFSIWELLDGFLVLKKFIASNLTLLNKD